jgi:hypothetical protein
VTDTQSIIKLSFECKNRTHIMSHIFNPIKIVLTAFFFFFFFLSFLFFFFFLAFLFWFLLFSLPICPSLIFLFIFLRLIVLIFLLIFLFPYLYRFVDVTFVSRCSRYSKVGENVCFYSKNYFCMSLKAYTLTRKHCQVLESFSLVVSRRLRDMKIPRCRLFHR